MLNAEGESPTLTGLRSSAENYAAGGTRTHTGRILHDFEFRLRSTTADRHAPAKFGGHGGS